MVDIDSLPPPGSSTSPSPPSDVRQRLRQINRRRAARRQAWEQQGRRPQLLVPGKAAFVAAQEEAGC